MSLNENGFDEESPSVFEVLAQENLTESLRPAVVYLLKIFAGRFPSNLGCFYKYCDEIVLLLELILENYHLKFHNASFSEFYYGIKRVPSNKKYSKINSKQKIKSLFLLVIIPYILDKVHKTYDKKLESNRNTDNNTAKLTKTFIYLYPYLHALWQSICFIWLLLYILRKTHTHSPLIFAADVCLKIITSNDLLQATSSNVIEQYQSSSRLFHTIKSSVNFIADNFVKVLTYGATTGAFFVQFLEWWYANDEISSTFMSLPVPEPPKKLQCRKCPADNTRCPLCLKTRSNDTVISVTGFVFCYPCIYKYVELNKKCPITEYPITIDHLVRIFDE